ncbi:hypothetical protein [Polyangium aurulentum]|uniref:hypothetical protein n=1 Tax=Polyangium aurulentum TaxID=2567896 RepID=UPI00146D85B1|nr:hypothetical protein [Polyangium aurulentum]UQA58590.1 hypothetical protein E8A73_046370 [Polyangium aurulentum]
MAKNKSKRRQARSPRIAREYGPLEETEPFQDHDDPVDMEAKDQWWLIGCDPSSRFILP